MNEKIVRCRCGRPYRWYSMYCGDQSYCPRCRQQLQKELADADREMLGDEPERFGLENIGCK